MAIEELREDFAKQLISKIEESDYIDFDNLESEDEELVLEVEEYLVGLCQLILDEAIIVESIMSGYKFLTLLSNKENVMSEANRRID